MEGKNLKFILGDITKVKADAIVNAANESLLGGEGVDGAIHSAAGPKLLEECATLGGCKYGEAKITKGYNLPAKYVIHTVGPRWLDGDGNEKKLLAQCYQNSLELAEENNINSIAFPAISTGDFGMPIEATAPIAIKEVSKFLKNSKIVQSVTFVLFSQKDFDIYRQEYLEIQKGNKK